MLYFVLVFGCMIYVLSMAGLKLLKVQNFGVILGVASALCFAAILAALWYSPGASLQESLGVGAGVAALMSLLFGLVRMMDHRLHKDEQTAHRYGT